MRLNVFLLLICCVCLRRVDLSLPDFIPVTPPLQVKASVTRTDFTRLPGLCQRLKRRRVTILCRLEKFCWRVRGQGRSQGRGQKNQSGQLLTLSPFPRSRADFKMAAVSADYGCSSPEP
ncbi:uncharacterized protein AKAME5_002352400 [Lates japonicus]|uniref:Secreted protein n=1 Tax=Lates japonicus TaxID=270547 RepID=A0AAD3NI81_LATJO|nr:uncharacterized protein AKAME5_002352400 [Lates japonicus]